MTSQHSKCIAVALCRTPVRLICVAAGGYGPFESNSPDVLELLSCLEERQRVVIERMSRHTAAGSNTLPQHSDTLHIARERTFSHAANCVAMPAHPATLRGSRVGVTSSERKSSAEGQGLQDRMPFTLTARMSSVVQEMATAVPRSLPNALRDFMLPQPPALQPHYVGTDQHHWHNRRSKLC